MADLWIRTQGGNSLLKVDNINYCGTKIYINNHEAAMSIDLGEYDTEERAKEVLDEIQDFLLPRAFIKNNQKVNTAEIIDGEYFSIGDVPSREIENIVPLNNSVVYEMPEK